MINGIGNFFNNSYNNKITEYNKKKENRNSLDGVMAKESKSSNYDKEIYLKDSYFELYKKIFEQGNVSKEAEEGLKKSKKELDTDNDSKSKTDSNIIVKPDGSRVLVVTTNVGGTESTMCIELSKPNEWDNANSIEDLQDNIHINDILIDTGIEEVTEQMEV